MTLVASEYPATSSTGGVFHLFSIVEQTVVCFHINYQGISREA